jgi:hypothetical protein
MVPSRSTNLNRWRPRSTRLLASQNVYAIMRPMVITPTGSRTSSPPSALATS